MHKRADGHLFVRPDGVPNAERKVAILCAIADELLRLQQTAEPPLLPQVRADVPEAIEQLVNQLLANASNVRPQ